VWHALSLSKAPAYLSGLIWQQFVHLVVPATVSTERANDGIVVIAASVVVVRSIRLDLHLRLHFDLQARHMTIAQNSRGCAVAGGLQSAQRGQRVLGARNESWVRLSV